MGSFIVTLRFLAADATKIPDYSMNQTTTQAILYYICKGHFSSIALCSIAVANQTSNLHSAV